MQDLALPKFDIQCVARDDGSVDLNITGALFENFPPDLKGVSIELSPEQRHQLGSALLAPWGSGFSKTFGRSLPEAVQEPEPQPEPEV